MDINLFSKFNVFNYIKGIVLHVEAVIRGVVHGINKINFATEKGKRI